MRSRCGHIRVSFLIFDDLFPGGVNSHLLPFPRATFHDKHEMCSVRLDTQQKMRRSVGDLSGSLASRGRGCSVRDLQGGGGAPKFRLGTHSVARVGSGITRSCRFAVARRSHDVSDTSNARAAPWYCRTTAPTPRAEWWCNMLCGSSVVLAGRGSQGSEKSSVLKHAHDGNAVRISQLEFIPTVAQISGVWEPNARKQSSRRLQASKKR